jgi:hypothetical protein
MGTKVAKRERIAVPPKGATFYAAGRFKDYGNVRKTIDRLATLGYKVTYDWTRTEEFGKDGHPRQDDAHMLGKETLRQYAYNDLDGVGNADFMVVLADNELAGAWVEFGAALALGVQPIYVIEPYRWTIFLECDGVVVLTWAEFDAIFPVQP